jgi:hypothetical protein
VRGLALFVVVAVRDRIAARRGGGGGAAARRRFARRRHAQSRLSCCECESALRQLLLDLRRVVRCGCAIGRGGRRLCRTGRGRSSSSALRSDAHPTGRECAVDACLRLTDERREIVRRTVMGDRTDKKRQQKQKRGASEAPARRSPLVRASAAPTGSATVSIVRPY